MSEWDRTEFPEVDDLAVGRIITQCWHLEYNTVAALQYDFEFFIIAACPWYSRAIMSLRSCWGRVMDYLQSWMMRRKCYSIYATLLQYGMSCFAGRL